VFDLWCSKWILYKCFSDKRYLVIFCCAIWCAHVLHCITLRRHANPVCLNSYFCQTPKIVTADENVLITFSFVRKSGTVYWWGPCSRPSIWTLPVCCRKRPSRPTCSSHILRIENSMCFVENSQFLWSQPWTAFHNCDPCIAQAKPHVIGLRRESDSWLHFWQTLVRKSW